jgi:hypothetical protein
VVILLPWHRQERICLTRLLRACGEKALLPGDRGRVGFVQSAMMLAASVHCCLRLPRCMGVHGAGKANRHKLKQPGKQDMLVTWGKGDRRVKWLGKSKWKALPEPLTLRQMILPSALCPLPSAFCPLPSTHPPRSSDRCTGIAAS